MGEKRSVFLSAGSGKGLKRRLVNEFTNAWVSHKDQLSNKQRFNLFHNIRVKSPDHEINLGLNSIHKYL
jgi:hypothetical protein